MLNERGVRDQLAEVKGALGKLDDERNALLAIEQSLLNWLDLHSVPNTQLPLEKPPIEPTEKPKPRFAILGTMKLEDAIIRALHNRAGERMNSQAILDTAKAMGVKTNSKDPIKVIEWVLYDIVKKQKAPIRKIAPHTYVYHRPVTSLHSESPFSGTL